MLVQLGDGIIFCGHNDLFNIAPIIWLCYEYFVIENCGIFVLYFFNCQFHFNGFLNLM